MKYRYLFIAMILILIAKDVTAKEHHVNQGKPKEVKFISDAPVEDFEGVTDNIDGYAIIDGIDKLQGAEFYFEVDLRTLDTGIGLRNRHMRDNYLHTDKYPYAKFKGTVTDVEMKSDNKAYVTLDGTMDIHGKKNNMKINGWVTTNGFGSYRMQSRFDVKLTDHNIEVPELMFMKIDEDMEVVVDFYVMEVE